MRKPAFTRGRERMRSPVAAKIALQIAGAAGGRTGSPNPTGGRSDSMKWSSTGGTASMRGSG